MRRTARAAFLFLSALLTAQSPTPSSGSPEPKQATAAVRLVYEVPFDALETKLQAASGRSLDELLAATVQKVEERLPSGAKVERTKGAGFVVTLADAAPAAIARVRQCLESGGRMEMRIVASRDQLIGRVPIDLRAERQRLEAWLDAGHRAQVLAEPSVIAEFHADPAGGPLAGADLRWCVHRVAPDPAQAGHWGARLGNVPGLQDAVVMVDPAEDWNAGLIPGHVQKRPAAARCLVELVAINRHELHFTNQDLAETAVQPANNFGGSPSLSYRLAPERAAAYADWSEKFLGCCSAILLDGEVLAAPRFESRIPGHGQITGNFTKEELEALQVALRAPLPAGKPRFVRMEPASK